MIEKKPQSNITKLHPELEHKATYDSPNPILNLSHQSRLQYGIELFQHAPINSKVLDYGCGNARFLCELHEVNPNLALYGYEKFPDAYNPISLNGIEVFTDWRNLQDKLGTSDVFDFITLFEVLEHCHVDAQNQILRDVQGMLKTDGTLIVSVPMELGPVSLLKNIARFKSKKEARYGGYSFGNVIRSLLFKEVKNYRNEDEFLSHMGFDFRKLKEVLLSYFEVVDQFNSPFKGLPYYLNSQVFFVLKQK